MQDNYTNFFEVVKELVSIADVGSHYGIDLSKGKVLCPFHNEKTPSFSLHPSGEYAKCFGCGASADAIELEFKLGEYGTRWEAIMSLNERHSLGLEFNGWDKGKAEEITAAYQMLEKFCMDAHKALLANRTILAWLEKNKGLTIEDVKKYRIGYVGKGHLTQTLKGKQRELAIKIGLLVNKNGRVSDYFWQRIAFPIHNREKIVGIWARQWPDKESGFKYIGLPCSELMPHKPVAFRENINCDRCVVVESISDAIAFIKAGIPACSPIGTEISKYQSTFFKNARAKLYFAGDPDSAGEISSTKWARKYGGLVINLGSDKDADALLAEVGLKEFKKIVEKAMAEAKECPAEAAEGIDVEEAKEKYHGPADKEMITPTPFPFDAFPPGLLRLTEKITKSIQVDPEMVISTAMGFVSGAIGNTVKVIEKPGHIVSLFTWFLTIAESGYGKTPAQDTLFSCIDRIQAKESIEFEKLEADYKKKLRASKHDPTIEVPEEPKLTHRFASDITVEGLGKALKNTPRGLAIYRDEVSGFVSGMNQYKPGGKGNDRQFYVELFDGRPIKIDRKTGNIWVPNPGAAIIGGIQPKIMPVIFSQDSFDDGFLPRFLFINSPNRFVESDGQGVSDDDLRYWQGLIKACYDIPLKEDEDKFVVPITFGLDDEAKGAWLKFSSEYGRLRQFLSPQARVFIPKLLTYTIKFMGLLYILNTYDPKISLISQIRQIRMFLKKEIVENAIKLTRYFLGQIINVLELYKPETTQLTEYELRLIQTLYALKDSVINGRLLLSKIVEVYNSDLPPNLRQESRQVASLLRSIAKLTVKTGTDNKSFLIWEGQKISILFSRIHPNYPNYPNYPNSDGSKADGSQEGSNSRESKHSDDCDCAECVPTQPKHPEYCTCEECFFPGGVH